jgi:ABC-type transporter Mla MlaB component
MEYTFKKIGYLGIYKFHGELTSECENDLLLLLMRSFYKYERVVIDLHNVKKIDQPCISLLKKAYMASKRFNKPFILNGKI